MLPSLLDRSSQGRCSVRISPERVRQLTIAGRLPCTQTPLGWLYRESDVQALAPDREARTQVAT